VAERAEEELRAMLRSAFVDPLPLRVTVQVSIWPSMSLYSTILALVFHCSPVVNSAVDTRAVVPVVTLSPWCCAVLVDLPVLFLRP